MQAESAFGEDADVDTWSDDEGEIGAAGEDSAVDRDERLHLRVDALLGRGPMRGEAVAEFAPMSPSDGKESKDAAGSVGPAGQTQTEQKSRGQKRKYTADFLRFSARLDKVAEPDD